MGNNSTADLKKINSSLEMTQALSSFSGSPVDFLVEDKNGLLKLIKLPPDYFNNIKNIVEFSAKVSGEFNKVIRVTQSLKEDGKIDSHILRLSGSRWTGLILVVDGNGVVVATQVTYFSGEGDPQTVVNNVIDQISLKNGQRIKLITPDVGAASYFITTENGAKSVENLNTGDSIQFSVGVKAIP